MAISNPLGSSGPKYKPDFSQYMGIIESWEGADNSSKIIAANPDTKNYVYRDANGILTDKYGNTGQSASAMLARTEVDATSGHFNDFFVKPGIDKLPAEIQPQLFDISINGGPGRATDILGKVLTKAGKGSTPADAEAYLKEVGMAKFNNDIAAERIAFYDDLARSNPAKAVNLNGWHRRAAGFIMTGSVDDYAKAGFKIVDGKPMLPDQVTGADGKPAVKMPDGSTVSYEKWYGDNVIAPARNDKAKFDEARQKAIHYTRPTGLPGDWGDENSNAPVPIEDWSPQDRALFQFMVGILGALFKSLAATGAPASQQPTQLVYADAQHNFGQSAPFTPPVQMAAGPPLPPRA